VLNLSCTTCTIRYGNFNSISYFQTVRSLNTALSTASRQQDNHIQQVASKLSKNIGILAKLKYTVSQKVLCLIYNSLVLPYLAYCNLVWACNSTNKLKSVVILQKRAVRNIAKVDYRAHTSPLLKKLDLLKVTDICCFQTALFMFKFLVRERSALADPYCHSAWISVGVCVCLSATLRSNISETKGARGSVTMGSL